MSALILPSRFTRQPQQSAKIDPAYAPYVAALMNGSSPNTYLGKFGFTEQSGFTENKFQDSLISGRTLSVNPTSVSEPTSLLTSFQPINNDFSFIGVIRVRGYSNAGVGIRSKGSSDTIILRISSSKYSVRIAGQDATGGVMPLDTELNYVLTSNSGGVHLWVNGVEIINVAPTTNTGSTGGDTSIYADNYFGGSMDMDAALLVFLSKGISRQEAAALSRNPWLIYQAPPRRLWIDAGSVPVDPIHDLTGQNSQQNNTVSTSAITQTHALAGANANQGNIGTAGSVSQVHLIAGSSSHQVNLSIVGSVSQSHVLAGSNSRQVNTTSAGSVSQARLLTGANSLQINIGTAGAVTSGESTIIKPNKKLIIAGKQRLRTYVGAGRVRSVVG